MRHAGVAALLAGVAARRAGVAARHAGVAALLALGLLLATTASAFAAAPEHDGSTTVISPPGDEIRTVGTSAGGPEARGGKPGGGPKAARGYDISYPQCGGAYPANPAFGIVGVNGGKVFSVNECLASQIAWGGGAAAELYVNTGNPGPALSSFWPTGQTTPLACSTTNPDTAECAYDYGWNAAQHSYQTVQSAYRQLDITSSPAATSWWLDVETSNSWRDDVSLNVSALQGEVAYLRSVGVTRLGFYSTTYQWGVITGGSKVFAPLPSWGAGTRSEKVASNLCASTTTSFTGGPLTLVQYPSSGFDADLRC